MTALQVRVAPTRHITSPGTQTTHEDASTVTGAVVTVASAKCFSQVSFPRVTSLHLIAHLRGLVNQQRHIIPDLDRVLLGATQVLCRSTQHEAAPS